jgi:hypothetical protein
MSKKDEQSKAAASVEADEGGSSRRKKSEPAKVLLDQDQSRVVVKLVKRRLKKIAKKGQNHNRGKEVAKLRDVASALGTDYRLKWSKDKDKYIIAAHAGDLS